MEFWLYLPQMRVAHDAMVERALAAEAAGFTGMAMMDHLAPPMALDQPMWDAMTTAAWILARTATLQVGHLVLCDAFRHPAVLAREIVSLDHASSGRFELGIGWGSVAPEFDAFGVEPSAPNARVSRLRESLEIMRALWTGEPVDYAGDHFTLKGAQLRPVPTRRIPITIGGTGKRTLELVREHANWWNVPLHQLDQLEARRGDAGNARVSMQVMVALVPSEDQRDEVTATVERRYGGNAMGETAVIGTAAELRDHFARVHATGVDRFYVWFADFAPVETLQAFVDVIL